MNKFFYGLGRNTIKAERAVVRGTGAVGGAVADAATSYMQGCKDELATKPSEVIQISAPKLVTA